MINVSICKYFSVLNVFIVCIHNTAMLKIIPFCALTYIHICLVQCTPEVKMRLLVGIRIGGDGAMIVAFSNTLPMMDGNIFNLRTRAPHGLRIND